MSYDPWQNAITKNGYPCDEVISALQKCIRRGLEEEACMFAYELFATYLLFLRLSSALKAMQPRCFYIQYMLLVRRTLTHTIHGLTRTTNG